VLFIPYHFAEIPSLVKYLIFCKWYGIHSAILKENVWYLSAIEIIDTQVARRGRQYHRNPPYKKQKEE
jgi:hypothetical protein